MSAEPVFLPPPSAGPGTLAERLSPRGHACAATGLTLIAMPPGRVEVDLRGLRGLLNVLPFGDARPELFRVNGIDVQSYFHIGTPCFDMLAPPERMVIVCDNPHWEALVEFDPDRLPGLMTEAQDGRMPPLRPHLSCTDPALLALARLALDHLRLGPPDRLYAEGLAVAMTARALMLTDGAARPVPTGGTDARIARAIDHAEAHLHRSIGVAELAAAAAMSPSWFVQCFRAATGQPVHAYVRDRRLDRARRLLAEPRLSLAQVAHACGFADQSHMTRLFRRRWGTTPARMRRGG